MHIMTAMSTLSHTHCLSLSLKVEVQLPLGTVAKNGRQPLLQEMVERDKSMMVMLHLQQLLMSSST